MDPKPMSSGADITITAADGHVLSAYLVEPSVTAKGGLVVCQDAYGVGEYIKSVCDHYGRLGYKVIAPAFYDRQRMGAVFDHSLESRTAAGALRKALDWDLMVADAAAAIARVVDAGQTGILGFCVGGSMAWYCAHRLPLHAASCYYGKDIVDWLDQPPACATELHYGMNDHLIPAHDIETVRLACPHMDFHAYAAGHGFDGAGKGRDEASSHTARARTAAFFAKHLAGDTASSS